ncbi:hypothetical protein OPIT5_08245 [Opitutaceae bacterium TAV5]|nr:hypothetical protein OPIT5_08245 [Opitutaceae bacterium TAV5]
MTTALALVADPALAVKGDDLDKLKSDTAQMVASVAQMQTKAAMAAVLSGIALHRVKASLKHGEFGKWIKQIRTSGANLKTADRQCNYYMRLATAFLEKAKAQKPALLALPGDQTALELGDNHPARDLFTKLERFVGGSSLNELLDKHGIKSAPKLGGKRTKGEDTDDGEEPEKISPEELAAAAKEELGEWFERGRQLLITENLCARLAPADIRSVAGSFDALRAEWRDAYKKTLKA